MIDGVTAASEDVKKPGEGWIFVCRNGLPAAFLDSEMRRAWATGLHHHDLVVQRYAQGLSRRAAELRAIKDRTTLILPYRLERTFVKLSGELVEPHSDAPGYLANEADRQDAWARFLKEWGQQANWFQPGPIAERLRDGIGSGRFGEAAGLWQNVAAEHLSVTHIPDVWIAVDEGESYTPGDPDSAAAKLLERVVTIVDSEKEAFERSRRKTKQEGVDFPSSNTPMSSVGERLQTDLDEGKVRIVKVSAAELNPRYRGRFEKSFPQALLLLMHCAATLLRSGDEPAPAD